MKTIAIIEIDHDRDLPLESLHKFLVLGCEDVEHAFDLYEGSVKIADLCTTHEIPQPENCEISL